VSDLKAAIILVMEPLGLLLRLDMHDGPVLSTDPLVSASSRSQISWATWTVSGRRIFVGSSR
jgi:hypothetical protein